MVDCFSALREAQESRVEKLRDECFICGYTRSAFDDLGGDFNFDKHMKNEHHIWSYLYFIAYLKEKDPTGMVSISVCAGVTWASNVLHCTLISDYNGVETFVTGKLEKQDLKWVPTRTSWEIENQRSHIAETDTENMHFNNLLAGLDHLDRKLSVIKESMLTEFKTLSGQRDR